MRTECFDFAGGNQMCLPAMLWLPENEPDAILQVTHGMTEHIGRYSALAQALTADGIAVAGFDLRGHGKNPGNPNIASFGEAGWEASLADMHSFFRLLEQRFPGVPHYMLGFSLGSFLLREYLGLHPEGIAGAAILGTGYQPSALLSIMAAIVRRQITKAGFDGTTDLVRRLSFETYNQKFKPNRTSSDWLCADDTQLDAYLADPMCRKDISAGLFWQLLGSMKRTGAKDTYVHWNKNIPILLLSGQSDPVGDAGKGVQTVYDRMKRAGMTDVTMHLIPNARHDLLHEESSGSAASARRILSDWLASVRTSEQGTI